MRTASSDLDQPCDIVTSSPSRRTGPMLLRNAIRCVVDHRPLAEHVAIELEDGRQLDEADVAAMYEVALVAK